MDETGSLKRAIAREVCLVSGLPTFQSQIAMGLGERV